MVDRHLALLPEGVAGEELVLDLDGIRYVTSTVLGAILTFNRRVRSAGGKLVLANVSPFVQETLAVTCLDQLMALRPAEATEPAGQPA